MVLHSILGYWKTQHEVGFVEEETDGGVPFLFFSFWDFVLPVWITASQTSWCFPPQVLLSWPKRPSPRYFIPTHGFVLYSFRPKVLVHSDSEFFKLVWKKLIHKIVHASTLFVFIQNFHDFLWWTNDLRWKEWCGVSWQFSPCQATDFQWVFSVISMATPMYFLYWSSCREKLWESLHGSFVSPFGLLSEIFVGCRWIGWFKNHLFIGYTAMNYMDLWVTFFRDQFGI